VPLRIVDGQEITWEKIGQMRMRFKAWQFKLEIRDSSGEV